MVSSKSPAPRRRRRTTAELFWAMVSAVQRIPKGFAFLLAGPFVTLFVDVGPPGPEVAFSSFTAVIAAATIAVVYLFTDKRQKRACRVLGLATFLLAVVLAICYYFIYESWVVRTPTTGTNERRIMGFEYLSETEEKAVQQAGGARQALAESDYDPDTIWTHRSITLIQLWLLVFWAAIFAFFYAAIVYLCIVLGPMPDEQKPAASADGGA